LKGEIRDDEPILSEVEEDDKNSEDEYNLIEIDEFEQVSG
jgi:hypothetical protein